MRSKLVPIGNSRGIRLPKAIIEAASLKDDVDLRVEQGKLVITAARPSRRPRAGWAAAIQAEVQRQGPLPVDAEWESLRGDWDDTEWQW
jgi:antitoxin MazE